MQMRVCLAPAPKPIRGNQMKVGSLIARLVGTFVILVFLGTMQPVAAQSTRVLHHPLAKLGHRDSMKPNTNAAIVTENGPVKGVEVFGIDGYLGIPYAAPPFGDLRWMPPQPPGKFHGVFQANNFGNSCTQPDGAGGTLGSEDCLTLNVFTPIERKNQNKKHGLPVMVWIHGGSLVTGGSFIYDPSPLMTNGNVIVVTINYRLGYLGFLAHPAIDAEGHTNGNYGFMDQQF